MILERYIIFYNIQCIVTITLLSFYGIKLFGHFLLYLFYYPSNLRQIGITLINHYLTSNHLFIESAVKQPTQNESLLNDFYFDTALWLT